MVWEKDLYAQLQGNNVIEGEPGELLVRGPSVVVEYYKSPEFTAQSFTEDLFYRTGDEVVLVNEGRIKVLGSYLRKLYEERKDKNDF